MTTHPLLRPLPERSWGPQQARHLLARTTFGAPHPRVQNATEAGLKTTVQWLLGQTDEPTTRPEVDPDIIKPPTREQRMAIRQARREQDEETLAEFRKIRQERRQEDRQQMEQLVQWWLKRLSTTDQPLEENLTLLWHDHFATQYRAVRDSYLMVRQNILFRDHGLAFDKLAHGIVRDPAMLRFLNNDRNRRQAPNENLARELMELFTLGEGNYQEADIKEGARALTGYTVRDNDFAFNRGQHDPGPKQILGQRGNLDGDDFVNVLLARPECPQLVARKIYEHFVGDIDPVAGPDRTAASIIEHLGQQIAADEYDLTPALSTLLSSRHFFDASVMGRMVKSPVQVAMGLTRTLGLPERNLKIINQALRQSGQQLFNPPSVAGWDGGRAWVNTSTMFIRQNLCLYLLVGRRPHQRPNKNKPLDWDTDALLAGVDRAKPAAVVDRVAPLLLGVHATDDRRRQLAGHLGDEPVDDKRLLALLAVITGLPEFQLT
ncbi:MAG: DUF1800 domain-containing protein [Phycisphaeraceae bacterium]|nr:DUF1800 domain-containing protein [Phycisphaeraceae bacterium]